MDDAMVRETLRVQALESALRYKLSKVLPQVMERYGVQKETDLFVEGLAE